MELAITLVAPGKAAPLLLEAGAKLAPDAAPVWLCEGLALDVHVSGDLEELRLRARDLAAAHAIDICVQSQARRKKRMLIADMDSTIIEQECIDEMADMMGIKPQIASLTERAMRGELNFEAALRERICLLKGFTRAHLSRVLAERIRLNLGARTLVTTMAAHGAHTILVSGGFMDFTTAVAQWAGFAKTKANAFVWDGDQLIGVEDPILGREAKLAALEAECESHGLSHDEVLAIGDGANDLDMLEAAGLGVAYHAKPVVAAKADAQVRYTGLTTLLYYQGYRQADFIANNG